MPSPTSTGMVIGTPGSVQQFEYHGDTGNAAWAPRVSYGTTGFFTIRASALSTALVTSNTGYSTGTADFISPPWANGIQIFYDVSAVTSATSGNVTIAIELLGKDPLSGNYVSMSSGGWMIGTSSGVSGTQNAISGTTGTLSLQIHPNNPLSTGRSYNAFVPPQWKITTTFSGSSFANTWSLSGQFKP